MSIKKQIFKMLLGYKHSSEAYIRYLRKMGVEVGEDVTIFRPFNTTIDSTSPHLLSIGNHVVITGPVTILTHDYSWAVLKRKYGDIVGNKRKTVIGNNVFIGWGATILGGAKIGDNVIIGASSVVSGNVEHDSVYAGNPAKKIMSLDEFYRKRIDAQLGEAVTFVNEYYKRNKTYPEEDLLDEYFFLFSNSQHNERFDFQLGLAGNYQKSNEQYEQHKPMFESYDKFLEHCKK